MEVVKIQGGRSLNGTVDVSGAKNACLPIFAATLLTDEPCIIENVPNLSDVRFMAELIREVGAEVEQIGENSWRVFASSITHQAPYHLVKKMRASVCLLGPFMGRLKKASIALPGGCVIGHRPIDLHLKGLEKLGCKVDIENGDIQIQGDAMRGARIFLGGRYGSTVTGTANILMAAVLTPGVTTIESAACEPEIDDLCHMLLKMGAKIEGIGSHTLVITGVDKLRGCKHSVIADRIEAGTFIIAGLLTEGIVTVKGARAEHLGAFLDKLETIGADIEVNAKEQSVTVFGKADKLKPTELITLPYPGFPTDLQAQFTTLMAATVGLSIITERVYPNRFMHVSELQRMGVNIALEGASAVVHGEGNLSGAPVMASDLRASAALFLAGLAAEGETWVQRVYHLDRGYDKFDEKLCSLGASIERMDAKEMPVSMQAEELVVA